MNTKVEYLYDFDGSQITTLQMHSSMLCWHLTITIVCICFNLVLYAVTGAYLYISLLSSGGCFGAWIDHLDSFKNPNLRHSKVGFLKVVCYKH